jgi:hypothetical protein
MVNYILGLLKGMIIGICIVSLDSDYWGYPLVVGTLTLIGVVIEIKNIYRK